MTTVVMTMTTMFNGDDDSNDNDVDVNNDAVDVDGGVWRRSD